MFTSFVMTILGSDRPGLVESVAEVVAARGGNWVESRMAHLAGQFAGVVRVEVAADRAEELREALVNLDGISVSLEEDATAQSAPGQTVILELVGPDRAGIVREISHALRANGINVEELETACTSAPMSGERLFKASAKLGVSGSAALEKLRQDLEEIANQLTLEIDLIHRKPIA